MGMPWFKMHADFYHCPKVQSMSEAMQRRLIMLFCLKCSGELDTLSDDEVRFALRVPRKQWATTKALFIAKGFIDEALNLLNWDKRQFSTEGRKEKGVPMTDAERAKLYRERKKESVTRDCDASRDGNLKRDTCHEASQNAKKARDTAPPDETENSIKNQQVKNRHVTPLDKDLDLDVDLEKDKEDLKAHAHASERDADSADAPPLVEFSRPSSPASAKTQSSTTSKKIHGAEKPDEVEQGVWDDFLKLRQSKKAPFTNTALNQIKNEAQKANMPLNEALVLCCARGWQGFKADWVAGDTPYALTSPLLKERSGGADCPVETIVQRFNALLPELDGVTLLTEQRKKNIAARWNDHEVHQSIDFWEDLFNNIRHSDFLMGRTPNERDWRMTIDWLIEPSNFAKVIEGHYLPRRRYVA